jgi:toxin ParE1/3/4
VAKLELTPAALGDLANIDERGAAEFGEAAADAYAAGLRQAFDQLERFPMSSPARPDFGEAIRCRNYRAHRILYTVDDDLVVVVRVVHHAQDVPSVLNSD